MAKMSLLGKVRRVDDEKNAFATLWHKDRHEMFIEEAEALHALGFSYVDHNDDGRLLYVATKPGWLAGFGINDTDQFSLEVDGESLQFQKMPRRLISDEELFGIDKEMEEMFPDFFWDKGSI